MKYTACSSQGNTAFMHIDERDEIQAQLVEEGCEQILFSRVEEHCILHAHDTSCQISLSWNDSVSLC